MKDQKHGHGQAQIGHVEDVIDVQLTPRIYPHLDEVISHDDEDHHHWEYDLGGEG